MKAVTDKFKYLEAMAIIKDEFYSEDVKEKYKLVVKEYLNKTYKQTKI
jgi:membrane protease subunit (stomatin/prohibitin family)